VAEQWGRRWITIDTSRVAVAIARQRLLTARFDRYRVQNEDEAAAGTNGKRLGIDPHPGFVYKTVPHITLKSIAQNTALDPIFARHEPILAEKLRECNKALAKVTAEERDELARKLVVKQREQGARSITEADRRRWLLPKSGAKWEPWQVPFDTDPDWPKALIEAVTAYRAAWRAKMDEVNSCIAANAEQEELVDQPEVLRGIVRVSGPFTVEAVQPPEMSLEEEIVVSSQLAPRVDGGGTGGGQVQGAAVDSRSESTTFGGEPEELPDTFLSIRPVVSFSETQNLTAYLEQMVRLLRQDGVRFPDNRQMRFTRLEPLYDSGTSTGLHAEGRWVVQGQGKEPSPPLPQRGEGSQEDDGPATVGVAFGPQYGPVTAKQVEDLIRPASRRYEDLVVAGFSFDGTAQTVIEEAQHPKLRIHMAHIRPDVNPGMNGLLKEQPGSQLFTVFGQPRTEVKGPDKHGEYTVIMEGVDIYNPVDNSIASARADKVAAWFLDSDYDGRTFCVTQAFFPDRTAWDKLARALADVIDADRFEALSGTVSLPFPAGKHKCIAVKVIDPRGNEVMQVKRL
jgi:adenine-specific DNA-methyltransferase